MPVLLFLVTITLYCCHLICTFLYSFCLRFVSDTYKARTHPSEVSVVLFSMADGILVSFFHPFSVPVTSNLIFALLSIESTPRMTIYIFLLRELTTSISISIQNYSIRLMEYPNNISMISPNTVLFLPD